MIDSGKWVVEKPLLHILGDPIVLLFACFVFSTPEEGYYLFLDKALTLLSRDKYKLEDGPNFCCLLRISEL